MAVNLPADVQEALAEATVRLQRSQLPVRWVPPGSMHVTLKFLGEVDPPRAALIGEALAVAVAPARSFDVTLGGLGAFPSFEAPRIVWIGVERHPALELLANDVERAMVRFGFESELRPFLPHVTLGRVEKGARRAALKPLKRAAGAVDFAGVVVVERVDLMRSETGSGGSVYHHVAPAPLRGGVG